MSNHASKNKSIGRRKALSALTLVGLGAAALPQIAAAKPPKAAREHSLPSGAPITLSPIAADMTHTLQAAIEQASSENRPLVLAPGRYPVRRLVLRSGLNMRGAGRTTRIDVTDPAGSIVGDGADGLRLSSLTVNGARASTVLPTGHGLVGLRNSSDITITDIAILASSANGLSLEHCGGLVARVKVRLASRAAIFSIDATGLAITDNDIADCADNGILVWTTKSANDGTLVSGNRIARIGAASGGSGQYGNGVNVFRAGAVIVSGNHISDCAFTAVRGNAASNIQITTNTCLRLGEVAIYAEFGFEGALIQGNLIDRAACGISVTNFNEGGRLAVIQGNLVRNLFRREHEPVDKRGEGIAVEADASISGNTIENAPTAGIMIGWGRFMRNVVATGNMIRTAGIGIAVSGDRDAGTALISSNLIAGATRGAVRAMHLAEPVGPDLATAPVGASTPTSASAGRIIVQSNAVA